MAMALSCSSARGLTLPARASAFTSLPSNTSAQWTLTSAPFLGEFFLLTSSPGFACLCFFCGNFTDAYPSLYLAIFFPVETFTILNRVLWSHPSLCGLYSDCVYYLPSSSSFRTTSHCCCSFLYLSLFSLSLPLSRSLPRADGKKVSSGTY